MRWPFTRTATIATEPVPKDTSDSASTRFAFRLFRQLCEHRTTANMFFSPGSVALCVAQVKELASGETRRQISNALEISALDQREIEMEIATLKAAFGNRPGAQMSFANALWLGQHVEIEELAVAVDGGQPVAELVRDAGRQLADRREAVLQPQLLFEIFDSGQIREQADGAVHRARAVRQRRHRHAEM